MQKVVVPDDVIERTFEIVNDVSDDVGEEDLGNGYLLKYEGWSEECVKKIFEVESLDSLSEDEIASEAAERSIEIIYLEWVEALKKRGYVLTDDHGYDEGGLYGRTWAIFKKV